MRNLLLAVQNEVAELAGFVEAATLGDLAGVQQDERYAEVSKENASTALQLRESENTRFQQVQHVPDRGVAEPPACPHKVGGLFGREMAEADASGRGGRLDLRVGSGQAEPLPDPVLEVPGAPAVAPRCPHAANQRRWFTTRGRAALGRDS
ncbi:hypothetical protein [Kitasatospora sp. NPDC058190]|uniref:hypothetical protein n=1 Tax=Kitasatospora sp. NPDC058190 TaxID=3346371 RepID=UPI0036DB5BA3